MKTIFFRLFGAFIVMTFFAEAHCSAYVRPFRNLDFEEAFNGNPPQYGIGPVLGSTALPHWTWSGMDFFDSYILCNQLVLDGPSVSIMSSLIYPYSDNIINGNYSLVLQMATMYAEQSYEDVSISQTGTIPSDAKSIRFLVEAMPPGTWESSFSEIQTLVSNNLIKLSLNGNEIPLSVTSIDGNTMQLAGDVSDLVSQTVSLKISVLMFDLDPMPPIETTPGYYNIVLIDDIEFSPVPVPEPATIVLLVTGLIVGVFLLRRK